MALQMLANSIATLLPLIFLLLTPEVLSINNTTFLSNLTSTNDSFYIIDDLDESNRTVQTFKYSTPVLILLVIVLVSVILGTITGNILVITAVCLVKKLRRPSNYLIVSLAVSDLFVAAIVMPISMLYEILGHWPFGPIMCDFWVSFDVLSCAASILNLCMISVDRYYAITKPLEYGVKRTPKRMLLCVFIVWITAAFISLPPLLILGNEKGPKTCIVCQKVGYQIYATFGSFYLPLTVMIVVYCKIFSAARKIVREEKRAQSHLESHCYLEINVKNGNSAEAKLLASSEESRPPRGSNASTYTTCSVERTDNSIGRCFSSGARKSNESQCPMLSGKPLARSSTSGSSQPDNCKPLKNKRRRQSSEPSNVNRIRTSLTSFASRGPFNKDMIHHSPHHKKLRFQLAKERKASTTLGIIMSAFIICWLPFMVLALIKPFMADSDAKEIVGNFFLWLGYANSLLNPIIYATLNRDFRKPFQEILFFRCSNLNSMMREEFYHSQYGDPEQHYCVSNNANKIQSYEEGVEIVNAVVKEGCSESFL